MLVEEAESDEGHIRKRTKDPLERRSTVKEIEHGRWQSAGKARWKPDGLSQMAAKQRRVEHQQRAEPLIRSILLGIPLLRVNHRAGQWASRVVGGSAYLLCSNFCFEFTPRIFLAQAVVSPRRQVIEGEASTLSGKKYSEIKGTKVKNS